MKVTIDLAAGPFPHWRKPTKKIIDRNIEAINRAVNNKMIVADINYLIDTKSILLNIRAQLPEN